MITKNILHSSQIGFMKGKRTSDHIFVLKCILEEAKSMRKPICACFVDLKKAFDTVWREGLYYKLLFDCRMSTKFVKLWDPCIAMWQDLLSCTHTAPATNLIFQLGCANDAISVLTFLIYISMTCAMYSTRQTLTPSICKIEKLAL